MGRTCQGGANIYQFVEAALNDREVLLPLDVDARRILTLGQQALTQVVDQALPDDLRDAYDRQPDALCSAAWLHIAAPEIFEDVESFLHATHYQTGGKRFKASETDLKGASAFDWTEDAPMQLAEAFTAALQLKSKCTITHFDYQPQAGEPHGHMLIIRHAGPLSSVTDHREDRRRTTVHYRPPNEATLLYFPSTGTVELCSDSPSRAPVATGAQHAQVPHHRVGRPPPRCTS